MNLNKVILIGRIPSDITLKATPSNQAVTNFSIATNRVWTDKSGAKQESAEFHNIVAWGRHAELASQFLSKGSLVMIEGRLQTRSWKDNNNVNHKVTEIICENIQFGPRSAGGGQQAVGPRPKAASAPSASKSTNNDFEDSLEENLPQINMDEDVKPEDLPF